MAIFDSDKGNVPWGFSPNSSATQFGSGLAAAREVGTINLQLSSAGISPGATAADNVLAFYSIPAGSFDAATRGIYITAVGSFATGTNTKQIKIIFNPATAVVGSTVGSGGTTIADSGSYNTTGACAWQLTAAVYKYGVAGSNTQFGIHYSAQIAAVTRALVVPTAITAVESGAILIAVTGAAGTTASDILFNFLEITAMN